MDLEEPISPNSPIMTTYTPPSKKKYNITDQQKRNELLQFACDKLQNLSNDNDILAKSWALELNQLEPDQKLFAQKAINDILFEARLKTLNRNSVQIYHQCSSNTLLETPMYTSSNSSWNYSNNTERSTYTSISDVFCDPQYNSDN
ncbi:hypothetical protein QTP88_027051 [Uroleucon formosanum]